MLKIGEANHFRRTLAGSSLIAAPLVLLAAEALDPNTPQGDLGRAAREPDVRVVRASVGPDNVASLRLLSRYGFVEVGEQWDDEDGPETVFEVDAR